MDIQPGCCIEVDFVDHHLIECRAEKKDVKTPEVGGNVTFEIKVEVSEKSEVLKKEDILEIKISLECIGVSKEHKETAFEVFCKMRGFFEITSCPEEGIVTEDNRKLLSLTASCLYPLLAQHVGDLLAKMDFRGIEIPPFSPKQMSPLQKNKKAKPRKKAVTSS